MKAKQWSNGNKMLVDSEHKTFNRQCKVISTGNVWSDTQHSGYIRTSDTTECNGHTSEPKSLQRYDLKPFYNYAPSYIVNRISELVDLHNGGIFYVFFHYNGDTRVFDGAILTDKNYNHIRSWYVGNYKQQSIIDTARQYITNIRSL